MNDIISIICALLVIVGLPVWFYLEWTEILKEVYPLVFGSEKLEK